MHNSDLPMNYLDEVSLNRLADKHALDAYLYKEKVAVAEVRFLMSAKLRELIRELVTELPSLEQGMVRMRFWQDLSVDEIAASLDLDRNDVQGILMKALKTLRTSILARCQSHLELSPKACLNGPRKLGLAAH